MQKIHCYVDKINVGYNKLSRARLSRRFNAIVPLESAEERGQGYRCAITFNEDPSRRKIWPGSKNFLNFNPSFESGYAEEKKATFVL